jgi:hypothetical protein
VSLTGAAAAAAAADSRMTLLKEGDDADETAASPDLRAAALSGYWAKVDVRFSAEGPSNSDAAAADADDDDDDAADGGSGGDVGFCGAIMNSPSLQNT